MSAFKSRIEQSSISFTIYTPRKKIEKLEKILDDRGHDFNTVSKIVNFLIDNYLEQSTKWEA